jgi:hypothetical protein
MRTGRLAAHWTVTLAGALLAGCIAGCTDEPTPVARSTTPTPPPAAGTSGPTLACPTAAQIPATGPSNVPEREGVGAGATLWALFFAERITADTEAKIVWRMTGSGDFAITATNPDGVTVRPSWGPEEHGGSGWSRPGDEWGTGWVFPSGGCWTFTARRADANAQLVVRVA